MKNKKKEAYLLVGGFLLSMMAAVLLLFCIHPNKGVYAATTDEEKESGETIGNEEEEHGEEQTEEVLECICTEKCKKGEENKDCPLCSLSYKNCEVLQAEVIIEIEEPKGYITKPVSLNVSVYDKNETGLFTLKTLMARIGSNGDFYDIKESGKVKIDEDCTVYIQATDEDGNVFSYSKKFICFDNDKPTLNAGIEGEVLYVQADDATSGIDSIFVNGNKFNNLTNDTLTINLNECRSEYENITLIALDKAGNRSLGYKIKNSYYVDPQDLKNKEDESKNNPVSLSPSEKSSATATVTSYTDLSGETTKSLGKKEETISETVDEETENQKTLSSADKGKEFYTITTDLGKVFYLIIDNERSSQNVYLLTEVNENDLLNFVNYEGDKVTQGEVPLYSLSGTLEEEKEDVIIEETNEPQEEKGNSSTLVIILLAAVVVLGAYFFKKKGNKGEYEYDEEDSRENEREEERIDFAPEKAEGINE